MVGRKTAIISIAIASVAIVMAVVVGITALTHHGSTSHITSADLIKIGDKYLDSGNFDLAIDAYIDAIAVDSKNFEAYDKLANLYLSQEKPEYTIAVYTIAADNLDDDIAAGMKTTAENLFEYLITDSYAVEHFGFTASDLDDLVSDIVDDLTDEIEDRKENGIYTDVDDFDSDAYKDSDFSNNNIEGDSNLGGFGFSDNSDNNTSSSDFENVLDKITIFGKPMSSWDYSSLLDECRSRCPDAQYGGGAYSTEGGLVSDVTFYCLNNDGGLQIENSAEQAFIITLYPQAMSIIFYDSSSTGNSDIVFPADLMTNKNYLSTNEYYFANIQDDGMKMINISFIQ